MTTQRRCGSFLPGHNIHYIQALKLAPREPGLRGRVDFEGSDRFWFSPETGEDRLGPYFQHAMPLVREAVREAGGHAELLQRLSLLRVPDLPGRAVYYLSEEPLDPCHPAGPIDEEWVI